MGVQYSTVVGWDATLRDVQFADADTPSLQGLAISAIKITAGAPTATVGQWLPGATVQNIADASFWRNTGTTAAPTWYAV